jgi:hypothetical protein
MDTTSHRRVINIDPTTLARDDKDTFLFSRSLSASIRSGRAG